MRQILKVLLVILLLIGGAAGYIIFSLTGGAVGITVGQAIDPGGWLMTAVGSLLGAGAGAWTWFCLCKRIPVLFQGLHHLGGR